MASHGHARIRAAGPQQDRAALLAHARATARDGHDFTLSGLIAPDAASDGLGRWAELTATGGRSPLPQPAPCRLRRHRQDRWRKRKG